MRDALTVMLWPLVACLALPGMLVYYGLHIVRRGVIFVDLALAQVATLGTCVCLYLGHDAGDPHNYYWSLGFTLVGALAFTFTRPVRDQRVPEEALIGIVYVVAAGLSIVLLSKSVHGKEELQRTLVGDLLTVGWQQVARTFALYAGIAAVHFWFRRQILAISFAHEQARAQGLRTHAWDFLFYALFGLVVTSFVQLGGVLLVFSYLIVPAVCANLLAESMAARLLVGWSVATVASMLGLYASYRFDLPTGAAIVCSLGGVLVGIGLLVRARLVQRAD